jgi:glycosyltransferase involved in cell wall biosynthesis
MDIRVLVRGPIYFLWSRCPEKVRNVIRRSLFSRIVSRWLMDFEQYLSLDQKDYIAQKASLADNAEVDVVITSYRQANYLQDSMESILKQTVAIASITLVNHCPDKEEIEKFNQATKIFLNDPRVKVLHLEECWPGVARNKGAELGGAPFIVFVDVDDWISSRYLETALLMIATTDSDFAGADCEVFNEAGFLGTWNLKRTPNLKDLIQTNAFPVGSVIKRNMFVQLNGWNDLDQYGLRQDEAIDFWRRSLLNGFQGSNARQQLIHLRRHASNLSHTENSLVSQKALKTSFRVLTKESKFPRLRKSKRVFSLPSFSDLVSKISTYKFNRSSSSVVFLVADGTVFGAGKVTQVLIQECLQASLNVIVINFDYRSQGIPLAEQLNVQWVEFGSTIPRHSWLQTLELWIDEIKPNWIISTGHPDVDLLMSALRKRGLGKRIATTMFNTQSLHASFISEEPDIYNKILVESNFSKNWLMRNGVNEDRIEIIRHLAHRLPKINHSFPADSDFQNEILMGWFHRFSWEKQPNEFLRIASEVIVNNYKFVMGGSGPLRMKTQENNNSRKIQFEKEGISSVEFLSKINVAFVTSSEVEGRPLAVLEALELGKVVIAYNVGAMSEIADLGYEGIYLFDNSKQVIEFLNQNQKEFASLKESEKTRMSANIAITNNYVAFGENFIDRLK